jgi:putative inorganic carbon (hco3(-)) transporter
MRDLLIVSIVVAGCLAALWRPWIGVLLWTWLSMMNPHRYTYGFAYSAPLAAMAAASIFVGLLITKDKESPLKGRPVAWFLAFIGVMTVSWLLGISPSGDYEQWKKVMKIDLMILVALALIHSKKHIMLLAWTAIGSLALLGVKGGIFTILHGGNYRVWGPPGSFVEDNNEFALAMVMTVPLLRFLQLQVKSKILHHALLLAILLCAASAFGSHSRGGFLAVSAMALFLWWRSKKKLLPGILIGLAAVALIAFMPAEWTQRMNSIQDYNEDRSALGRISAWWNAWNLAWNMPFGAGFNAARPELYLAHSPYGLEFGTPAAHSIYFQILGNHGFLGLALFLAIWVSTWRSADGLIRMSKHHPEAKWCGDLGAMSQVMLLAYAVGGAFLSLSYFDLPYNVMVMVVCARVWLHKQAWVQEDQGCSKWQIILGCGPQRASGKSGG